MMDVHQRFMVGKQGSERGPSFKLRTSAMMIIVVGLAALPQLSLGLKPGPLADLHIMGLLPMKGSWNGGEAVLKALELGLEHVNNREDILPGHRIVMHWMDTECSPGYGVYVMYKMFNEPPPKIIVLGSACSIVSQPTAESSQYWNVTQLSYLSGSPALSDKTRYPRFFRVASSSANKNPARVALLKHFNWRRVATMSESAELFTKVTEDLARSLSENNITLITAEIFTDDASVQVANLKKHDARIIILGSYEDKGVHVVCQAYRERLYGSHIVWFLPGFWSQGWWTKNMTSCTTDQLKLVVDGAFHTERIRLNPEPVETIYGMTPNEFQDMYENYIEHEPLFGANSAPQCFDSIMVLALVFNMTINQLREKGSPKRLEDFTYDDMELNDMIYNNFWKINFVGAKGNVYFDENGDSPSFWRVDRTENFQQVTKGIYNPLLDTIDWFADSPIIWSGGAPPADSTTVVYLPVLIPLAIYGTMSGLAGLGILLGCLFLAFNAKYRNLRVIKMSSPFINNIIVIGCMIVYSTVFVKELDTTLVTVMCQVRTITLMVGFSTAFGALFAKTWRVHVIFTNKLKRMIMKDRKLLMIIGAIVGIDVILFVVFTVIDPISMVKVDTDKTYRNNGNLLLQSQVYMCQSNYRIYFEGAVFAIKGLMLIFGIFLAWETRKVNIPALNDSHSIGVCIYNVAVLSIMGVVLSYVLTLNVTLHYVLTSAILIIGTTMTQAIIFVPKIIKVKDGAGVGDSSDDTRTTFATQNTVKQGDSSTTNGTYGDQGYDALEKELKESKKEVDKLKKQLAEKEEEIRRLQGKQKN